jgi:dTDP-4-dehydrorhamnose reductase
MKVLVLGHKGMLGHMVTMYMRSKDFDVITSQKRWPTGQSEILNFDGDYIINCIGSIPQRTDSFNLNWQLPIWLDLHSPCRVIHPGTDCEMDNDDYGISKNIAGNYIRNLGKQTKSIKTSIIGPELNGNASLMEWFLSQKGEVFGYTKAIWDGNTTLEWAKQCWILMNTWHTALNETIISSTPISKFDLLHVIKDEFNKDINIKKKELGNDKCLNGTLHTGTIQKQLKELKNYYYD